MDRKTETVLRELLDVPELRDDSSLRRLIESILIDLRPDLDRPGLRDNLNLRDLLSPGRIPFDLDDFDHLRRLLRRIEDRIEVILDRIIQILDNLRRRRRDSCKDDPIDRRELLRLILQLVNLINLRNIIRRLLPIL